MRRKFIICILTAVFVFAVFALPNNINVMAEDYANASMSVILLEDENPDYSAAAQLKYDMSEAEQKISSSLLKLTDSKYISDSLGMDNIVSAMEELDQIKDAEIAGDSKIRAKVYVYIQLFDGNGFENVQGLTVEMVNAMEDYYIAAAWVDVDNLIKIAELEEVRFIREVTPPVIESGTCLSAGDAMHRTDDVRNTFGADGSGIKVGIISDGVDHLSSAVASGNLPSNVTVLSNTRGGDEGTAMLEIVHDLAPGAQLYFHDAGANTIAFCNAIQSLADAGCDVICDDVAWVYQPYFEDGSIADYLENLLSTTDIIYTSSAGNYAQKHYQGQYNDSNNNGLHTFISGSNVSDLVCVVVPPGAYIQTILQWNDQFGHSSNNYDLVAYADAGSGLQYLGKSADVQNGNDDPLEAIIWENTTNSEVLVGFTAANVSASGNEIMEMFFFGGNGAYIVSNQFMSGTDSIFGHAAVPEAIACGAVHPSNPSSIASYSSHGPVTMVNETRQKPDICGAANVVVSGAGGFGSYNPSDGKYYFAGTSAAAPHIAAIAAVLMSRYPTLSDSEIRSMIVDSSVDLGSSGYDYIFGHGRANAFSAANSLVYVHYDSNGGSNIDSDLVANGQRVSAPANPTKGGFEFEGWYKDEACTQAWNFSADTVNTDVTLYAKWRNNINIEGSGTQNDPYLINSAYALQFIAEKINTSDSEYTGGKYFKQTKNISLSTIANWTPIGKRDNVFDGHYDGNNKEISGLNIDITSSNSYIHAGLFGWISGSVENVNIVSGQININNTSSYVPIVGSIAGYAVESTINNCTSNVDMDITYKKENTYGAIGGIVGKLGESSNITNCNNYGEICANGEYVFCGGIAGEVRTGIYIEECTNRGKVVTFGDTIYTGGIIGFAEDANILLCDNYGVVTMNPGNSLGHAGGIGGKVSSCSVDSCTNNNKVSSSNSDEGGTAIIGGITGCVGAAEITDCINRGNIYTTFGSHIVAGGINGGYYGGGETFTILSCINLGEIYSDATLTGTYTVGGIAAEAFSGTISQCFNHAYIQVRTYPVVYSNIDIGGIVGNDYDLDRYNYINKHFTVSDCYNTGKILLWRPFGSYEPYGCVGGIIGETHADADIYQFDNCYNTGEISGPNCSTCAYGNIAGDVEGSDNVFSNCYYTYNIAGIGDGTGTTTKLTQEQSYMQSSYLGFDFTNTWAIEEGQSAPYLIDNPYISVSGISFTQDTYMLEVGDEIDLRQLVAFTPSSATNKGLEFESDDDDLVDINDSMAQRLDRGDVTITVTTNDGSHTATCTISTPKSKDINNDGVIDMLDITTLAKKYNSSLGDTAFDDTCDLNSDGSINIFDLIIVAMKIV